ncbi:a3f28db2-490d-4c85-85b2-8383325dbe52 [Thermothielavioides terrestris]|uniref:A3f28db2-490d-4c85-85b2-8383325dbe52 n=1 Tax=Thermothielavioides terrestris TaxID=2587410 RepID=A0A3S5CW02_9PEZI|nr:a3f28db2-490d-4c85-85b2-8383325dbe52 [Thermothielavioides terrestris]
MANKDCILGRLLGLEGLIVAC